MWALSRFLDPWERPENQFPTRDDSLGCPSPPRQGGLLRSRKSVPGPGNNMPRSRFPAVFYPHKVLTLSLGSQRYILALARAPALISKVGHSRGLRPLPPTPKKNKTSLTIWLQIPRTTLRTGDIDNRKTVHRSLGRGVGRTPMLNFKSEWLRAIFFLRKSTGGYQQNQLSALNLTPRMVSEAHDGTKVEP